MTGEKRTTCTRDCPDTCGVIAVVEDGKIVSHRGDPAHGVTRGVLCLRGNNYLKRFYDPNRLLYPLRRTGTGWQRVSWDDALDLVASKLTHYRRTFGPRSVLVVNYSGVRGLVAIALGRLFWSHFGGATFSTGGLSIEANTAAQELDFGRDGTHEPEDLVNAAAFVIWGKNVPVTHRHWMPFIDEARKRGAPVAVIDPVRCSMAEKADRFYQIRPGSDGMLAIGVARLLLESNDVDNEFIRAHSRGFAPYRELVFSHTIQEVTAATDLTEQQISELARLYVERKPLATLVGLGPSYWENGGATVRLIDALGALSGNIGIAGGGVGTNMVGPRGLDLTPGIEARVAETRQVRLPRLGEEILTAKDPPLKFGWIAGANPAFTAPHTSRVQEALRSLDFLVVVEQFMTATTEQADLVLPCTTYLEMDELVDAYGHNWLGLTRQVVPPQGETKSDGEILQSLGKRLGFGAALEGEMLEWAARVLEPLGESGPTIEMLLERPRRNPDATAVPFADRVFDTPSGKFEFVGRFTPGAAADGEALHLIATKTPRMLNSQVLPQDVPEEPVARVNPQVLKERGLIDGSHGWVVSDVGRVRACLTADESVRRDVVLINPALWKGDLSGVNQLREAVMTDLGD
ncbi:MAG TPA: molybdopterin-dependent oxidoreductase, partial [Thermoleophilia bacterium]|nr:molybdopterin-dependent oxidoreductase [Thermoleophilia bacterium]